MEHSAGIDSDSLASQSVGSAHFDYHAGAVVFVGSFFQQRALRGALDLLVAEVGRCAGALQQSWGHAIDERVRR